MDKITDITLVSQLKGFESAQRPNNSASAIGAKFSEALKNSVDAVNEAQVSADNAAQQVAAGGAKNLHEAMIKLEEADISMRLMVQIRNKALDAYQEIMRMQV